MNASFDRIDSRGKDVEPTANLVGSFSKRVQHGGVPLSPKNFGSLLRETFFESILALTLSSLFFYSKRGTHTQVGLDAAGKTTILYKLKLGEIVTTIPTIGTFQVFVRVRGVFHTGEAKRARVGFFFFDSKRARGGDPSRRKGGKTTLVHSFFSLLSLSCFCGNCIIVSNFKTFDFLLLLPLTK